MNRNLFLMSLGVSALLLTAQYVNAAPGNCASHADVVERLASVYGETRQPIGLSDDNMAVEVFASLDTGSWTITVTQPGGPTCLAAAGQAFQHVNEPRGNLDTQG